MLVNPFICLPESHEVFDQDSLITPSFAPVTQTFYEKDNVFEKKTNILSRLLPRTTNTVIIKNLNFNCNRMSISNLVSSFGEISNIKHLNSKGMAIVTFYDSRCAESFVKRMDGMLFEQRKLRCDLMLNQYSKNMDNFIYKCPNVILRSVNNTDNVESTSLPNDDILSFVSENYGEVRQVVDCNNNVFIIEFYDFRNAQKMIKNYSNIIISQVAFHVSYAPEITEVIDQIQNEQDYHSKHDDFTTYGFRY